MRRTTLGPMSSSQLNARPSALRHPSTRVSVPNKSTTAMERQSIGVASRRVSTTAGTARRPPTGPRTSMNRLVDPRPVSDRSYQYRCVQTLVEFLSEHMYDQVIPQAQALLRRGPSKKDFENMILFLFKLIDPTFEFKGKFEEDVVQQLRDLRYPISISKTSLAAVGTPHTWPMLLMAMSWLIELLSYDEAIQQASENEQDGENDEENGDKPFFKYLDASYHVFLAGDDDKFEALENQEREKLSTYFCSCN
ncbi:kinetochore protein NDC80 [Phytophthora infestans T30-4]|uniref:Kinetochore protein NDC80 n=1 Tax=Phytophthora infestans (strain T30-4) TaxID=403677 RepID=D0N350_PHYIT|nr:kinetochore protein NDC80 [Phytophthora infestans T30-4]EEY69342.1 kinetochore protein NDC80 [Phytophthora infestans T30-4]|eukprot:XP_002999196.1 kinetochore protein NDC80 [Phytophthora infestans T30-4]